MASRIVVFFSHSGRTRAVAEGIARELGAHLEEIRLKKVKNSTPTPGMMLSRFRKGELPAIHTDFPDMGKFEEVILGGPVWGFNIDPPVLSFVESTHWSGKKVHLFVTGAGLGGRRALNYLRRVLEGKGAKIGKERAFPTFLRSLKALQVRGREWAKTLKA